MAQQFPLKFSPSFPHPSPQFQPTLKPYNYLSRATFQLPTLCKKFYHEKSPKILHNHHFFASNIEKEAQRMEKLNENTINAIRDSMPHRMIIQKSPNNEKYYIDESTGKAIKFTGLIPTDTANFKGGYLQMAINRASISSSGFTYEFFNAQDYETFENLYNELIKAKCHK